MGVSLMPLMRGGARFLLDSRVDPTLGLGLGGVLIWRIWSILFICGQHYFLCVFLGFPLRSRVCCVVWAK